MFVSSLCGTWKIPLEQMESHRSLYGSLGLGWSGSLQCGHTRHAAEDVSTRPSGASAAVLDFCPRILFADHRAVLLHQSHRLRCADAGGGDYLLGRDFCGGVASHHLPDDLGLLRSMSRWLSWYLCSSPDLVPADCGRRFLGNHLYSLGGNRTLDGGSTLLHFDHHLLGDVELDLGSHRGTCRRSSRERPRGKDQEEKSGSLQEHGRLGQHLCEHG
mmetsp:Transcript_9115/g.14802  ORF Transcript_9115/g.14802 Transcript_9115/m.14802 type:complete len:216 (-) Transcript_9115:871-1518(-)